MRKIYFTILVCFFVLSSVANAEITRGYDSFNDAVTINSWGNEKIEDFRSLVFGKIILPEKDQYYIIIQNEEYSNLLFAEKKMEIKLSGYNLIDLEPYSYKVITGSKNSHAIIKYRVQEEVVEKIKNTNRIAIRVVRNNGLPVVYVLPDDTLEEWKQVIATKE